MMDHNYIGEGGQLIPVSKMSTADIEDCLRDGLSITNDDGQLPTVEQVMDRLRLELLIRSLGL